MANSVVQNEVDRDGLRAFSKTLFGNADRIEVVVAIARSESGVVSGQELYKLLGIDPPRVRAQLLALTKAGLMRPLPRISQRQNYEVIDRDDPFWALIAEVANRRGAGDEHG